MMPISVPGARPAARSAAHPALRRYLRHGLMPQLAVLDAVVRLGSVTRAADALCMAQPTASGHLRKLSESLDLSLFEPKGRHLVPTEAAQALQGAVQEVFASLARVDSQLQQWRAKADADAGVDADADADADAEQGVQVRLAKTHLPE